MAEPTYKHIQCDTQDGILVVSITEPHLQGDSLADALRTELFDAVAKHGANKLVIDFLKVQYLSSAAFRPLLSLRKDLQASGGRFVLCNLLPVVEEVFVVTRLISTSRSSPAAFDRESDIAAAVAALKS